MRSSQEPSEALLKEASGGSPTAVEELLVRHLPGLRSYVRLKAGGVVLARETESDVVQSVCREVLQHAGQFQHGGEAGFRHWLFATALRKILDKHKLHTAGRRDVRREAQPDVDASAAPHERLAAPSYASPSGVAMSHERFEQFAASFDRLSPDHAEVVLLSRVVGLSRADVAKAMGRTEDSVRNLLHRALAELSRHLDRAGGEGPAA